MIIVSNASPLISLSKAGALEILPNLFGRITLAAEVFHEITVVGAGRPAATGVQAATWIEVKHASNAARLNSWKTQYRLGLGELATILLAQELSADLAIVDERAARRLAQKQGVKVIGCIGILEVAARKGLVPDLRATYQRLLATGTFIDKQVLNRSLTAFRLPAI